MLQQVHFTTLLQIKIVEVFGVGNGKVSGSGQVQPLSHSVPGEGVPSPSPDLFFKVYFIDYAITVVPIFPPLPSWAWYPLSLQQSPLLVHVCGSCMLVLWHLLSHAILNFPLSILFLPIMLLNPRTFFPILPLPPPSL